MPEAGTDGRQKIRPGKTQEVNKKTMVAVPSFGQAEVVLVGCGCPLRGKSSLLTLLIEFKR